MDETTKALLDGLKSQGLRANLAVFLEFAESSPEQSWIPASALRILAREGELSDEAIEPLSQALSLASEHDAFMHRAKAVAAFGRRANAAEGVLIDRLENMTITNDEQLWTFDSALHALGFVGNAPALAFVLKLKEESPSKVARSKSVYKGSIALAERERRYKASLHDVEERIRSEDPGGWTKKRTDKRYDGSEDVAPKKLSPWMTR